MQHHMMADKGSNCGQYEHIPFTIFGQKQDNLKCPKMPRLLKKQLWCDMELYFCTRSTTCPVCCNKQEELSRNRFGLDYSQSSDGFFFTLSSSYVKIPPQLLIVTSTLSTVTQLGHRETSFVMTRQRSEEIQNMSFLWGDVLITQVVVSIQISSPITEECSIWQDIRPVWPIGFATLHGLSLGWFKAFFFYSEASQGHASILEFTEVVEPSGLLSAFEWNAPL